MGGGVVVGAFAGMDLNNDGHINVQHAEVFEYSMHFYGNDHVPELFHDLGDLYFFDYLIGSTGFRPSAPLYSFDGTYAWDADDHIIAIPPSTNWTGTSSEAIVTLLPEPGTLLPLTLVLLLPRRKAAAGRCGKIVRRP